MYLIGVSWKINNYREIALQDVFYKILSNVIHNRLKDGIKIFFEDYQNEFCKSKSTIDQIFVIRQILEKHYEYNKEIQIVCRY